jgi:hypothetical protein
MAQQVLQCGLIHMTGKDRYWLSIIAFFNCYAQRIGVMNPQRIELTRDFDLLDLWFI